MCANLQYVNSTILHVCFSIFLPKYSSFAALFLFNLNKKRARRTEHVFVIQIR